MVDPMDTQSQSRLLIKILISVAWLDGEIQPQEREYLAKIIQTHQLDGAADIDSLLAGKLKISVAECEQSIQAYLGDRPIHDDDRLIEAISGLIYSDGDVAMAEAKLLVNIQSVPSSTPSTKPALIDNIRQLYHNWLQKIN
jgi:uncharacterized tellurite resistance protein B-like protein